MRVDSCTHLPIAEQEKMNDRSAFTQMIEHGFRHSAWCQSTACTLNWSSNTATGKRTPQRIVSSVRKTLPDRSISKNRGVKRTSSSFGWKSASESAVTNGASSMDDGM